MKSLDFFIVFVGLIIIYTCTLSLSSSKGLKKGKISKEVKAQAMKLLVEDLLIDQKEEEIAICSAIHNEGRWINEFILFHRLIGVDRFYLYDTGSDDDTIAVLTPWIRAGIVILHQFKESQGDSFQRSALRHCSTEYAAKTNFLIDLDADEFLIPTSTITSFDPSMTSSIMDYPKKALNELLIMNPIYNLAGAIAISRQTYKNQGIQRLDPSKSLLGTQVLRDLKHVFGGEKFEYTKTILHTNRIAGWLIPGPHIVKHSTFSAKEANMIDVMANSIGSVMESPVPAHILGYVEPGEFFYAGRIPNRVYEPLIIHHYIQRDLDNCLSKLAQEAKVHPEDWRVLAGVEGCKGDEQFQSSINSKKVLWEAGSFYAASTADRSIANSWFGRYLPILMRALKNLTAEQSGEVSDEIVIRIIQSSEVPRMVSWTAEYGEDGVQATRFS